MAEIPVEKKSSGMAWLWWLLLLAGVAALLWAIFDNDDDTPDVLDDDAETEMVAPDVDGMAADLETNGAIDDAQAGTIVTLAALGTLGDKIGQTVNLDEVAVNRVIGDMSFTVGEGANETLIRFDEVQTPDTAKEGLIDVNPGSTVSLAGRVESLDVSDLPQTVQDDLKGGNDAYIFAERVNVTNGGVNPR